MARLREEYESKIKPVLQAEFAYKNPMMIPSIKKIVLNMGLGKISQDKKKIDVAFNELNLIAGQRPVLTKAKKSIAAFKLREGMPIGAKVTLRHKRMYEFLDRLINIAMPRIRDFRGVSPHNFDGNGNFAMGIKEHIIFPEINYDSIDEVRGMDIIIVTSAQSDIEAKALLSAFKMPFTN